MSYLQLPGVERFRLRACSEPHKRYSSAGGLVNIEDLAKRYTHRRQARCKGKMVLFGSVSRSGSSNASSAANDAEEEFWDSLPLSPNRVEGLAVSETPTTPITPCKQSISLSPLLLQTPLVSKFNQQHMSAAKDIDFCNIAGLTDPSINPSRIETVFRSTPPEPPIELPGSLLLPSQGFAQSNPPAVPPRHEARQRRLLPPLGFDSEGGNMVARRSHNNHHAQSIPAYAEQTHCSPLPRHSSLPAATMVPSHIPPPIPLSQMTIEELMRILPKLDAAVIAQDWVPCMQKRQQELKEWLQKGGATAYHSQSAQTLEEGLRKVVDESQEIAKTYHHLFEVAKELQNEEIRKKINEVDEAYAQRSEAIITLARHVSVHNEKCDFYARELEEVKAHAAESIDLLSCFIHENLDEALQRAPQQRTQQIRQILVERQSGAHGPSVRVRSQLYDDFRRALAKCSAERDELRDVCSQQMTAIRDQSAELDSYISRMAKIIGLVQDKERENAVLRSQVQALKQERDARATISTDHPRDVSPQTPDDSHDDTMWMRAAEVANLRRKLEKSYNRENELQSQIRQLLQASQLDRSEKPAARLKRLLVGQQKSSSSMPTLYSAHSLSQAISIPFGKEKLQHEPPRSPRRSVKVSPTVKAYCEPAFAMDHLELPPSQLLHVRHGSSPQPPPKGWSPNTHLKDDDVDLAVSSRFHQRPGNVRSATSTPQSCTAKGSSRLPDAETDETSRSRLQCSSDHDFMADQNQPPEEQQPLMPHQRALSGITEVTEERGSVRRKSSSPDPADKQMFRDSMHAAQALGRLQAG